MFKLFKSKTPKEQAEDNKEKIINKNIKEIIKSYDKVIQHMIETGITYYNHAIFVLPITYRTINDFREETTNRAIMKLRDKYDGQNIEFNVTWTGCQNSYIGISVKFV